MKKLLLLSVAALLLGAFSLEAQTQDPFISVWDTDIPTLRRLPEIATDRDIAIHAIGTNYTIEWIKLKPDTSETPIKNIITNATSTLVHSKRTSFFWPLSYKNTCRYRLFGRFLYD